MRKKRNKLAAEVVEEAAGLLYSELRPLAPDLPAPSRNILSSDAESALNAGIVWMHLIPNLLLPAYLLQ